MKHSIAIFCVLLSVVLAGCVGGNPDSTSLGTDIVNNIPLKVVSGYPIDEASGIAIESTIKLSFNIAVDENSISYIKSGNDCTGSIQVSSNNFATCVAFLSASINSSKTAVELIPLSVLTQNATYKIRVTTGILSAQGKSLLSQYQYNNGFLVVGDLYTPTISSISPADGAIEVNLDDSIIVNFSEPMNSSTISTTTASTSCVGSLQLSADNFNTCIKMASTPLPSNGARSFTITPNDDLIPNTTYRVKVAGTIADLSGKAILASEEFSFTTAKERTIKISWQPSPETSVNKSGGGYRVYYSQASKDFDIDKADGQNVPYVSGVQAPTETNVTLYKKGTWYFKIIAFSANNPVGSIASEAVSINVE